MYRYSLPQHVLYSYPPFLSLCCHMDIPTVNLIMSLQAVTSSLFAGLERRMAEGGREERGREGASERITLQKKQ